MEQAKEYYQKWVEFPQPRKIRTIKVIAFVCYFLFLLLLVIYAFGRTGKKTLPIVPTILFTDGTPYNLQALRYLAQRRDVIIDMVVIASNSIAANQLQATTSNVNAMMTALGSDGFKTHVPDVYLSATSVSNSFVDTLNTKLDSHAANFLIVGPCTDAAYFLTQYPARRAKVNTIFVAGGAFNVAGNANYLNASITAAERNFYMDPVAADYIVARSHGVSVVLLPLDADMSWATDAYNAIVAAPASTAQSAALVSTSLTWYYNTVDTTRSTTLGIIAAAYAGDTLVQAGATVTTIPVRVYTTATALSYGQSYRPAASASDKDVKVVLSLVSATFFGYLVNVNKLALY